MKKIIICFALTAICSFPKHLFAQGYDLSDTNDFKIRPSYFLDFGTVCQRAKIDTSNGSILKMLTLLTKVGKLHPWRAGYLGTVTQKEEMKNAIIHNWFLFPDDGILVEDSAKKWTWVINQPR